MLFITCIPYCDIDNNINIQYKYYEQLMQITYSLIHTFSNIIIVLTILLALLLAVPTIRKSMYRLISGKRLKNIISLQNQYTYSIMYICYVVLMVGLIDAAWMYYSSSYTASYSASNPSQITLQSYQAVNAINTNTSTQISQKQKDQYIGEYKKYRDNYILERNLMYSLFAILVWFFFWKLCDLCMGIAQCEVVSQTQTYKTISNQNKHYQMHNDYKCVLGRQSKNESKSSVQQIQKVQKKQQQENLIKNIQKTYKQKANKLQVSSFSKEI